MEYNRLGDAKLDNLFSAEELYELSDLVYNELEKIDNINYQDSSFKKAVNERVRSLKCLRADLRLMADYLFLKKKNKIGLRNKNEIIPNDYV